MSTIEVFALLIFTSQEKTFRTNALLLHLILARKEVPDGGRQEPYHPKAYWVSLKAEALPLVKKEFRKTWFGTFCMKGRGPANYVTKIGHGLKGKCQRGLHCALVEW